jgi:histidyl-tRNA synthetase
MKFQTPKGTRDLMPEDAAKLQKLIDVVRSVFEKFGFVPIFTPAFEDFNLLSAKGGLGEAVKDEIYYFKDKSDRELGLRFDLTMPLVRVIASNPQLKLPFKRYAIGRVWRYDQPQAMRYREFWQADVDVVGSDSVMADVDCLAATCDCLEQLGFQDFFVRINNRKVVQAVFEKSLAGENIGGVFRTIDKLDKIGEDGVKAELQQKVTDTRSVAKIIKFLKISGSNSAIIKKLQKKYGELDGVTELEELFRLAKEFGIAKRLKLDLSLVRGLDYYTGAVFEIELGEGLSCGGGGRYDNLVKDVGGSAVPATGISLGISRIFEVMKKDKMFDGLPSAVRAFVANTDNKLLPQAVKVAKRLRKKEIPCQTDSMGRNLTKQLEYADSIGVDYVVIVGEKELKEGMYVLKDMKLKTEDRLKLGEIIKRIKSKKSRKMR